MAVFGHPSGSSVDSYAGFGWWGWMLRVWTPSSQTSRRLVAFSVAALPWARAPLVATPERPRVARPDRLADLGPSADWRRPRGSALGVVVAGFAGAARGLVASQFGFADVSRFTDRRALGFVVVLPGFGLRGEGVRDSSGARSGARSEVSMSL
jgi:hypothetical protein